MNRRQWLKRVVITPVVAATAAVLGGILLDVWMAAARFSSRHWLDVTGVSGLPGDGTLSFPNQRVALLLRGGRIGALSLECTHLGCLVNASGGGFFCPCHGSEFGPEGELWSGPAPRSLDWLPLQVHRGRVWVQAGNKLTSPFWVTLATEPAAGSPKG